MCSTDSSAVIYHLALISEQAAFTAIHLIQVMQIPAQGGCTITQAPSRHEDYGANRTNLFSKNLWNCCWLHVLSVAVAAPALALLILLSVPKPGFLPVDPKTQTGKGLTICLRVLPSWAGIVEDPSTTSPAEQCFLRRSYAWPWIRGEISQHSCTKNQGLFKSSSNYPSRRNTTRHLGICELLPLSHLCDISVTILRMLISLVWYCQGQRKKGWFFSTSLP